MVKRHPFEKVKPGEPIPVTARQLESFMLEHNGRSNSRNYDKFERMELIESSVRERCRELIDAADEMTRRLYCVVDWLALHPEYNPKTKVIPKKDYPVLVDVTF